MENKSFHRTEIDREAESEQQNIERRTFTKKMRTGE